MYIKKSLFCLFLLPRVKTADIVMLLEYKRKQTWPRKWSDILLTQHIGSACPFASQVTTHTVLGSASDADLHLRLHSPLHDLTTTGYLLHTTNSPTKHAQLLTFWFGYDNVYS